MPTRTDTLALGALMALAALLACFFFLNQSLRLDESQSLWQTGRSAREILTIVAQDVHVPLYHELLHFWRIFAGDGVEAGRIFSLVFYLLCIPALYALGRLAYGRKAGLFAAALLALSPFMNWYGSEIRMYALFTFLVIVNQYFFVRIMRATEVDSPAARRTWLGYALSAVFGIFTHYFFFLALASQAAYYLLRSRDFAAGTFRRLAATAALLLVLISPWAWWVFHQGQASEASPVLVAPTSVDAFNAFAQFVVGFQDDHLNTVVLSLWPIAVLLGFLALRKGRPLAPETLYFMITVFLSVALAFVASVTIEPVFVSRYLIFTAPSLYLLLASLVATYPPRAAAIARTGLVLLMLAGLSIEMASADTPVKENYREAAQYLTQNAHAQDVVILSAPFTVYPIEYYYRGQAPLATIPAWDRYTFGPIPAYSPDMMPQEVSDETRDHQYAWLLLSYDQGYEEDVRVYFDTHFERVYMTEFSPGLTLWVYKLRYDTPLSSMGFEPASTTPQQ